VKPSLLNKTTSILTALWGGLAFVWYFVLNNHLVLYYQEQTQMFQFTAAYWQQCLGQPGGISVYIATFFVQFFYYPWVGALIYTLFLSGLFASYVFVWKRFGMKPNLFALIPVLLILLFSTDIHFHLMFVSVLIFAFGGFSVLSVLTKTSYSYLTIPFSMGLLYLFSGGGILMTVCLFVLYSFTWKNKNRAKYVIIVILSGAVLPLLFWYFIYFVTLKEAYFSFTPFSYPGTGYRIYYWVSWALFLIFPLFRNLRMKEPFKQISAIVFLISASAFIMTKYNRSGENLTRMMQDADTNHWQDIIDNESSVRLSPNKCFYLNLALHKSRQLPSKMFHYDQVGTEGLFISSEDNFSSYLRSDYFLQLGLINEAKRHAYESLVGYSYYGRLNILTIKRLLLCAKKEGNEQLIAKYANILSHTLFYRDLDTIFDPGYNDIHLLDPSNFFVKSLEQVLNAALEKDPYHQMAFEYLMAYYMLEKKYEQAKQVFDDYYSNFNYSSIPEHYAELLVLYKRLNNIGDEFYQTYPISRDIREDFEVMEMLILSMTGNDKKVIKVLEDQFRHTYWFYVKFPLVNISTQQSHETKTIY
jgi:hypothetical protein